ncbi:MAG TPA: transposase [Tepidisphaeraceae bacterium]|jgi:putative transposase
MAALRKTLRRRALPGTARFLTFSCYRRLRLFDNDKIKDRFVQRLTPALLQHELRLLAWVVMPEHVHLIVFGDGPDRIPTFLQSLKDPFAREVLARWRSLRASILPRLCDKSDAAHFWQPGGGFDRNVIGEELIEKIAYIHKNPIARGLSPDSVSWKWSSAAVYRHLPPAAGPSIAFDLVPRHDHELT